nr:MAG TPA: hypothetical protein [Bacteriophage sp.]
MIPTLEANALIDSFLSFKMSFNLKLILYLI